MKINWYDDVMLKDGRVGCVIEIYRNDLGEGYEIELSDKPDDSETITVTIDQIKKIVRKNNVS